MPASRSVSRNNGSCVLGVHAATTTRFSPFSRIVSEMAWAVLVAQANRLSSAWTTLPSVREYSTTEGTSTVRLILAPQRHTKTPTLASSFVTSFSAGYTLSRLSLPRRDLSSWADRAAAALAVTTDSGMSRGPWKAPLMKIPGESLDRVERACLAEPLTAELDAELPRKLLRVGRWVQSDRQHHQIEFLFLNAVRSCVLDSDVLCFRNLLAYRYVAPDEFNPGKFLRSLVEALEVLAIRSNIIVKDRRLHIGVVVFGQDHLFLRVRAADGGAIGVTARA